jgi:hypothetical protein
MPEMRDVKLPLIAAALLCGSLAWSANDRKPAAAPVKPVVETLWGRKITDDYRYMEALDPSTIAWMKAQGAYTRSVLDGIKPLAPLKPEVAKFSASFGLIQGYVQFGARGFYEERAPGSDNFDLMVSDAAGIRKLVDVAALRAANGGKPFAINYFLASPMAARLRSESPRAARKMRPSRSMTRRAAQRSVDRSIGRNLAQPRGATIQNCSTSFACKSSRRMLRPATSILTRRRMHGT